MTRKKVGIKRFTESEDDVDEGEVETLDVTPPYEIGEGHNKVVGRSKRAADTAVRPSFGAIGRGFARPSPGPQEGSHAIGSSKMPEPEPANIPARKSGTVHLW